jgi:hypothetical protein
VPGEFTEFGRECDRQSKRHYREGSTEQPAEEKRHSMPALPDAVSESV